jgi:glutamyl-tRNA synthetase
MVSQLRWHLARQGIDVQGDDKLPDIVLAQRERVRTVKEMAANSLFFFHAPAEYDEKAVGKHVTAEFRALLPEISGDLARLDDWSAPSIHKWLNDFAASKGMTLGKLAQPLRLAVCGGTVSPPLDATLAILGKTETVARIAQASARWSSLN